MRELRIMTLASICMGGLLFGASPIRAADNDSKSLTEGAVKAAKIIRAIIPDVREVFVRPFLGRASADVGITKALADALRGEGFTVVPGAKDEVEGRIHRLPIDESKPLLGFTLKVNVVFANGNSRSFAVDVVNGEEAVQHVAATGEQRPPPIPQPGRPQSDPTVQSSHEAKPSSRSPYGVTILVETGPDKYEDRPLTREGDLLKVSLRKGDIFAIRVQNESNYDAAVAVLIDGLSRFAFSADPKERNSADMVDRRSSRLIKGYFINDTTVHAFLVGEYGKSAAAQALPSPADVGTVTVTFAPAWKEGEAPPDSASPQGGLGTAQGPPRSDPTRTVERHVGKQSAVVKIHY